MRSVLRSPPGLFTSATLAPSETQPIALLPWNSHIHPCGIARLNGNDRVNNTLRKKRKEFRALQRKRRQWRMESNCRDSHPVIMACFIECRYEDALFVDDIGLALEHSIPLFDDVNLFQDTRN